jgi:hypothetical protein
VEGTYREPADVVVDDPLEADAVGMDPGLDEPLLTVDQTDRCFRHPHKPNEVEPYGSRNRSPTRQIGT